MKYEFEQGEAKKLPFPSGEFMTENLARIKYNFNAFGDDIQLSIDGWVAKKDVDQIIAFLTAAKAVLTEEN